jgi:hypothetical protein
MADFVFNISKGRTAELYNRVDLGDPSTARLFIIPIDAGAITDATIKDCADFAAVITAGVTERAATGWNRKTITAADIVAFAADNTNDRVDLDIPDQTWTAVTAGAITDLIICYASVTSPTNGQLVPIAQYDFSITPDGSDVVVVINTAGFFRAS